MFKKGFYVGKLYITFSVIRRAVAVIVLVFLSIFTTVRICNAPSQTLKQEIIQQNFNNTKDIELQHEEATLIDTYGTSIIRGATTPQEPKVIEPHRAERYYLYCTRFRRLKQHAFPVCPN